MTNFELQPISEQAPAELMKDRSIAAMATWHMAETPYKNDSVSYPHERLWMTPDELEVTKNFSSHGRLYLPDGPWSMDSSVVPTEAEIESFKAQSLRLDTNNRPIHPWLDEMILSPDIGVVTGLGAYWRFGPNHTADTVLIAEDTNSILLIDRSGKGTWALPGGFLDKLEDGSFEDALTAAIREVGEETGVDIRLLREWMQPFYQGLVADSRITANAWAETNGFVVKIKHQVPCRSEGGDDTKGAAWFPIEQVPEILKFGSHSVLVELALRQAA